MSRSIKANTGRKIKQVKNPDDTLREAKEAVEKFHGRAAKRVRKVIEVEKFPDTLPVLGQLLELNIMTEDGESYVPIVFCQMHGISPKMNLDDMVQVCHTLDKKNIVFSGGNQELDLEKLGRSLKVEFDDNHGLVIVGPVFSIGYFTDKHHLEGPKYQAKGAPYEHEFGERADLGEWGEQPELVYDPMNKKIMLSGGSYEIRAEGIYN
jgi:hypothetical protein